MEVCLSNNELEREYLHCDLWEINIFEVFQQQGCQELQKIPNSLFYFFKKELYLAVSFQNLNVNWLFSKIEYGQFSLTVSKMF